MTVVGGVESQRPPANSTVVSFRLAMVFDEAPGLAAKRALFSTTQGAVATEANVSTSQVFVYEATNSRRRLMEVRFGLAEKACRTVHRCDLCRTVHRRDFPVFLSLQYTLNLVVEITTTDEEAGSLAGVLGDGASVVNAINVAIRDAPEGSPLRNITVRRGMQMAISKFGTKAMF